MTNLEYLKNCMIKEMTEEIIELVSEMDICSLCEETKSADCDNNCPDTNTIVSKWLKAERIADNDTQENNI